MLVNRYRKTRASRSVFPEEKERSKDSSRVIVNRIDSTRFVEDFWRCWIWIDYLNDFVFKQTALDVLYQHPLSSTLSHTRTRTSTLLSACFFPCSSSWHISYHVSCFISKERWEKKRIWNSRSKFKYMQLITQDVSLRKKVNDVLWTLDSQAPCDNRQTPLVTSTTVEKFLREARQPA